MRFNVGDVVALISGGPLMTVERPDDGGLVACCWFDGGELRRDRFDDVSLELVTECP